MLKNLTLLLASVLLSLWAADAVVGRLMLGPAYTRARELGLKFDTRDRLDVILDYRRVHRGWYPAVPANTFIGTPLKLDGTRVLPLGGVASARVVGCNEAGFYSTFSTDEAGFHNPPGTWPLKGERHVFVAGDSFTQGDCVREGNSVADRLRAFVPGVVNLGVGGNGPLLELAGIREYIPERGVRNVFWMYYEGNDLADLERDRRDPILIRYLEDGFSQRLLARQQAVNQVVRSYVEAKTRDKIEGRATVFRNLREAVWRLREGTPVFPDDGRGLQGEAPREIADLRLFERVLAKARSEVERKGGQLVLVYLPEYGRFAGGAISGWAGFRKDVLAICARQRIAVVDLLPRLSSHRDPLALFPLRFKGHYTAEGYALVAEELRKFLDGKSGGRASNG